MIALAMLGATPVLVAVFMCALEHFITRNDLKDGARVADSCSTDDSPSLSAMNRHLLRR